MEPHDAQSARAEARAPGRSIAWPLLVSALAGLCATALTYRRLAAGSAPTSVEGLWVGLELAALGALALSFVALSRTRSRSRERELEAKLEDVSERLERALHDAHHDPLTGLPRRAALLERLAHAVAHARRYDHAIVMMLVDLDRFQNLNDAFGNELADAVLREVASRISQVVRASDVVGRLGADTFGVVLFGAGEPTAAQATATQIRRRLARPIVVGERELLQPSRMGIAFYPEDAKDEHELLRRAELALSAAKDAGGDCVQFFEPTLHQIAQGELEIERELRLAIENKEFVLFFQPQLDLVTQEVIGAEALIRWEHPERGCLTPYHFLPVAERTGLIVPIGSWVIQAACAQRARWNAAGLKSFPISLNVSAEQFASGEVPEQLWRSLETLGLHGSEIHCEVTETCMIRKAAETSVQLEELRQLGARVALDDFGTGYSSLTTLSEFSIDVIKIDRSFVSGITRDPKKLSIVAGIVALAESLGLDTIAEGIEEEDELALVRDLGCAKGQGYFFAKPLPAEDFEVWVRARSRG